MPEELPEAVDKRIVIIDFMGFAHQVPVKKSKLKNFLTYAITFGQAFKD